MPIPIGVFQSVADMRSDPTIVVRETVDRGHVGQADLTDVITTANLLARRDKPTRKTLVLDSISPLDKLHLTGGMAVEKLEEFCAEVESIKSALT